MLINLSFNFSLNSIFTKYGFLSLINQLSNWKNIYCLLLSKSFVAFVHNNERVCCCVSGGNLLRCLQEAHRQRRRVWIPRIPVVNADDKINLFTVIVWCLSCFVFNRENPVKDAEYNYSTAKKLVLNCVKGTKD